MKNKIKNILDGIAGLYIILALWFPALWLYQIASESGNFILTGLSIICLLLAIYIVMNYKRLLSTDNLNQQ